jgi:flagellar export protein FliJ
VLSLREYSENQAKARLGEKSAVCTRLGLSLQANAKASLEAARERFRPGGNAADHRAGELYSVRLGQERERLLKALTMAEAEREKARLLYVEASKAKELIETLREREAADYYRRVSREETKSMDDLASGAHRRLELEACNAVDSEGHHGIVW